MFNFKNAFELREYLPCAFIENILFMYELMLDRLIDDDCLLGVRSGTFVFARYGRTSVCKSTAG